MSMTVNCSCGSGVAVELWDCGLDKTCSSCGKPVRVPDLVTLKKLNGDRYPELNAIQKIERTVETREPPFDGTCHGCGVAKGESMRAVAMAVLQERFLEDDGGIQIGSMGLKLVAAGGQELWNHVNFPLLLCDRCSDEFERDKSAARIWSIVKLLGILSIAVAFVALCYFSIELVAALSSLFWLVGAVAWVFKIRGRPVGGTSELRWARRISFVEEAIKGQEEFRVRIGEVCPTLAPVHQLDLPTDDG